MAYISPVKSTPEVIHALGQFTYSFANLEWQAICVIEALDCVFMKRSAKLSAGQVCGKLLEVINDTPTAPESNYLRGLYDNLDEIVADRNHLIHGRLQPMGEANVLLRLTTDVAIQWNADMIDDLCHRADMAAEDFKGWLRRRNFTQDAACASPAG